MNCKQAQRLFDDPAQQRLPKRLSQQLRQHLADCTDCRVLAQRSARLQRLLALKRYERPAPGYFENFVAEFHQRLAAETQRPTLWNSFADSIRCVLAPEPARSWRYGFAGAFAVALAVGLLWIGIGRTTQPPTIPPATVASISPAVLPAEALLPQTRSTPRVIATKLPNLPQHIHSDAGRSGANGVVVIPPAKPVETTRPRYVLDRISVAPASYEVASIHF